MISIIIVHYHVKKELFDCIQSIIDSHPRTRYEIIVVDNDEIKTLKKDLLKKFSKVTYIPNENKGFGQGNNIGSEQAKGNYLFFLNPDTIVFKNTIDVLYQFLKKNKSAGVVAPFLIHENKKPFEQQGVKELTPLRAIFSISIINKIFPNNPVAKKYFIQWNKIETKEVDVVPGTAFLISSELYASVKGFDENFFLYFEEFDLCKRIKDKGLRLFIKPNAKIIHLWERSTKTRNDISKIFKESRFYYFKKHFGMLQAIFTEAFLRISKYAIILFLIVLLAIFLRLYKLNLYMPFIGDQAWFFISARDMLLTGHIPLVGIASSHPWLHQGALWTYILAVILVIGHFNPFAGAYFTISLGILTIVLLYIFGSQMFSRRIGLFASLFYATAPFMILNDRQAYHTSLIPILTLLLFYAFYRWTNGSKYFFPLILFLLSLLYNFEIATVIFYAILFIVLLNGIINKTSYIRILKSRIVLLFSFLGLFMPMIPMILYDTTHGYPQTVKFAIWTVYKLATAVGFPVFHSVGKVETFGSMAAFASLRLYEFIFFQSANVSWLILCAITVNLVFIIIQLFDRKRLINAYTLLFLFFIIQSIFYIAERTNSIAYWIGFTPIIPFLFALFIDRLVRFVKLKTITYLVILLFIVINNYELIHVHYFVKNNTSGFVDLTKAVTFIINDSRGKPYNIIGRGPNSQYESFTANIDYLAWWMGHGPSSEKERLKYFVSEPGPIIIHKEDLKSFND